MILSIACGAGANVAIFSGVDALLFRPLPVPRPGELLTVGTRINTGVGSAISNVASYPDYVDLRTRAGSFTGLAAFDSRPAGFRADPRRPVEVKVISMVSGNFFTVVGVEPVLGRGFSLEDDRVPGRHPFTVLSHGAWQKDFRGDPSVIGRIVQISEVDFVVIGVLPERFTGLEPRYVAPSAYVPLAMARVLKVPSAPDPLTARDLRSLDVRGRLKPGVTLDQARAELAAIGQDLEREYPETNTNRAIVAQTEVAMRFERYPLEATAMVLLTLLSWAVLLVACANVAGLLSSRAPARAKEIALRLSIGAGRARLVRQLLTESVLIAAAGGLGGVAIGHAGIVLLQQIQFPTDIAALPAIRLDGRSLLFSLTIAMASAFVFGLGPALTTTRLDLVEALRATEAHPRSRTGIGGRRLLVSVQVALSLVVLTMSIYAIQVVRRALIEGPGFRTSHMAKLTLETSQARYDDRASVDFFSKAVADARELPGVDAVTLTSDMPLSMSGGRTSVVPEGYQLPSGQTALTFLSSSVGDEYFAVMSIPLVAGRAFRTTDDSRAPLVAIVNETFGRRFWPSGRVVGRRFRLDHGEGPWVEVIGVAKTTKYLFGAESPLEMIYFPFRQQPQREMVLLATTKGDSAALVAPLRDVVRRLDPDVPVYDAQTIEFFYAAKSRKAADVIVSLVGGMGLMGMTLTVIALYSLVAYAVSRRTREIAIRVAVGATYPRIVHMVLQQGMAPVWVGVAGGLLLSVATARLLPATIPIVERYNPLLNVLAVPLLVIVAFVAAFLPARTAARVNPSEALRSD
jgi:putative ABC transport system permease protein